MEKKWSRRLYVLSFVCIFSAVLFLITGSFNMDMGLESQVIEKLGSLNSTN